MITVSIPEDSVIKVLNKFSPHSFNQVACHREVREVIGIDHQEICKVVFKVRHFCLLNVCFNLFAQRSEILLLILNTLISIIRMQHLCGEVFIRFSTLKTFYVLENVDNSMKCFMNFVF